MEQSQLVSDLREKKRILGGPDSKLIESMSDSEVINSFLTCSDCGGMLATEEQVEQLVTEAHSVDEFLVSSLLDVERHNHDAATKDYQEGISGDGD